MNDCSVKGFLIDCARTLECRSYYEKALVFQADRGITHVIWHFCDDQGCQLGFKSVPGIGSKNAMSVSETRKLVTFARHCGIVLIPELAALGHSRYITRLPQYQHLNENDEAYSGMCPVHPETREVLALLLRETMEIFDSPEVHVGLDEVEIGQHPLTRRALLTRSKADIIADHIRFVHNLVVTEGGREMWMWGDGLLKSPEILKTIPKDIVVCNWQYRPTADASSTQTLLDAGFDVITASAILSHDQTLFPSTDYSLENVRALRSHHDLHGATTPARVRGEIITTWIPSRSLSEAQWLGWHLALDDAASSDPEKVIREFGRDFHGLEQTDEWSDACRTLIELSPQRPEWMAIVKLDVESLSSVAESEVEQKSIRWHGALEAMRRTCPNVRRNRVAFDALSLLFELLAHAYDAAAYLCRIEPGDSATLRKLLEQRRDLLEQLDAAWDRERFADDPAKFNPVVRFFRDDHLLLIVGDGLRMLEQRFADVPVEPLSIA